MATFAEVFAGVYTTVAAHSQHQDAGNTNGIMALYRRTRSSRYRGWASSRVRTRSGRPGTAGSPGGCSAHAVNIVITDWADEEARATTEMVFLAQGETGWSVQIVARYQDVFRPVDGRWLISRRADEYIGWQPPG